MKRNLFTKSIVVSVALSALLVGCGSTSSTNDDNKNETTRTISDTTISGKAVDGYLQFSTVCLDMNQDGYCQSTEPMTTTDEDGTYKLDIKAEIQKSEAYHEAMLLVYGGKDSDTGTDFRGKLLAPQDAEIVNISPITTLVAKVVQKEFKADKKLSKEQIKATIKASKEKVAKAFGLEVADLVKDPVAEKENNSKLIKEALKLQKAVEAKQIDGDYDDLEKVYEAFAEKLEGAEEDKALEALFDNDEKLLKIADNIEKSFEKYAGDLEKVAYFTKKDMKNIKEKKPLEDVIEIDDDAWDRAYIESALEDIGVVNPSQEQIEKIAAMVDGHDINPSILRKIEKELEKSDDKIIKDIYKEIRKDEAKKKAAIAQEKAKHDGQNVKFERGMTFFNYDIDHDRARYTEIYLGENDILSVKDFKLKSGAFLEDISAYDGRSEGKSYLLKEGVWVEDSSDGAQEMKYTLDKEGVLTLSGINREVLMLNQKDLSGKELYIEGTDTFVKMPKGAKESYMGVKILDDAYSLYESIGKYSSVSEYVAKQCSLEVYAGKDGRTCDADSREGALKHGTWSIKTVEGSTEVLVVGEDEIYGVVDGQLFRGEVERKGFEKDFEPSYNAVAMDAIKAALIANSEDDDREDGKISSPIAEEPHKDAPGFERPEKGEKEFVEWYYKGPEYIKDMAEMKNYWTNSEANYGYKGFKFLPALSLDVTAKSGKVAKVVDGEISEQIVGTWKLVEDDEILKLTVGDLEIVYGFEDGSLYRIVKEED